MNATSLILLDAILREICTLIIVFTCTHIYIYTYINEERRCRVSLKVRKQEQLTAILKLCQDVSVPDASYITTSLPPEPSSKIYYLKLNSGIGH